MPDSPDIVTGDAAALRRDPLSHGLWVESAPGAPAAEPLAGQVDADVVVVGAGFTGLAAALRLAEKGASVVVLEAHDIGFGASGRNVGLVNAGLWLSPAEVVDRLGSDCGERLMKLLEEAPARVFGLIEKHDMPCEARRAGTLHCAHSPAGFEDLRRRAGQWTSRGAPVELLDRRAAADKLGTGYFHGALLDRRAGTIHPLGYVRGLARAAMKAGARIHTGATVGSLSRVQDRWQATTNAGSATSRSVVIATNAYTEAVAPIAECIVPFSFFQVATPPLPRDVRDTILPEGHGAWDTAKVLTSLRLDAKGRLIAGSIGMLDPGRRGVHARWIERKIRRMFPQLEAVSFEYGWHGTIATTGDHLPRMAEPYPGVVAAYGYNGRGIGPGTVFGSAMADYLLGGDPRELPLPLTPMTPAPFRGLRALGIELGVRTGHWMSDRV